MILPVSASHIARITGLSHQCLAKNQRLLLPILGEIKEYSGEKDTGEGRTKHQRERIDWEPTPRISN
jgi:hypothetical protein